MSLRHLLTAFLLAPAPAFACSSCRSQVLAAVFDAHFGLLLLLLTLPVLLLVGCALWLYHPPARSASHADTP